MRASFFIQTTELPRVQALVKKWDLRFEANPVIFGVDSHVRVAGDVEAYNQFARDLWPDKFDDTPPKRPWWRFWQNAEDTREAGQTQETKENQ